MGHKTRGSHPTLQIRQVETMKLLSSYYKGTLRVMRRGSRVREGESREGVCSSSIELGSGLDLDCVKFKDV